MLEYLLDSKAKWRIVRLFINRPKWSFSLIEISKELKIPHPTIFRHIKPLVDYSILRKLKKGSATFYQLNADSYIVAELLKEIIQKENNLPIEKAKSFCRNLKPKIGIVFGSAARGEMKPTSDIDVALVVTNAKASEKKAQELSNKLFESEGLLISAHVFDASKFRKRYDAGDALIREIANSKVVYGDLEEVL